MSEFQFQEIDHQSKKNLQEMQEEEEDQKLVQQPPTISEIINNRSIGKFQFTAAFIIGTFCMFDCAELIIIAFLALIMEDIWDLSLFQKGMLGTALYVGYFIGSFIVGPISDHFGRKKTIITASIILFTAGTCSAFMPNYYLFALARSFVGLGIGMMASSGNTYLAEIYSTKWRGKLFQLHFLFGQIGQVYVCLLAYWLISDLTSGNWRLMILLVSLPTLIPLIGMFFMPESPLWLANTNRQQQAIDTLQDILRRNNDQPLSQQEIQGIRNTEPIVTEGIQNILNVQFRDTSLLLWYMWFANGFIWYGLIYVLPQTMENINEDDNENIITDILITIMVETFSLVYIFLIVDVEWLGRKKSLNFNFLFLSILLLCSAFIKIDEWFIYLISGVKFFLNVTFCFMYLYSVEYYPTNIRTTGLGIGTCFARFGGVLSPLLSTLLANKNTYYPYILYSIVCVIAACLNLFLKTETINKALDQQKKEEESNQFNPGTKAAKIDQKIKTTYKIIMKQLCFLVIFPSFLITKIRVPTKPIIKKKQVYAMEIGKSQLFLKFGAEAVDKIIGIPSPKLVLNRAPAKQPARAITGLTLQIAKLVETSVQQKLPTASFPHVKIVTANIELGILVSVPITSRVSKRVGVKTLSHQIEIKKLRNQIQIKQLGTLSISDVYHKITDKAIENNKIIINSGNFPPSIMLAGQTSGTSKLKVKVRKVITKGGDTTYLYLFQFSSSKQGIVIQTAKFIGYKIKSKIFTNKLRDFQSSYFSNIISFNISLKLTECFFALTSTVVSSLSFKESGYLSLSSQSSYLGLSNVRCSAMSDYLVKVFYKNMYLDPTVNQCIPIYFSSSL